VGILSDSPAAIRRSAHLDPGPGLQLARAINEHAWALRAHNIELVIHCLPEHLGIHGTTEADNQANKTREDRGYTVQERIYSLAGIRARRISDGRTVAKADWEDDKCSKHYGYRLKGKAESMRPVAMSSVKSMAARFY